MQLNRNLLIPLLSVILIIAHSKLQFDFLSRKMNCKKGYTEDPALYAVKTKVCLVQIDDRYGKDDMRIPVLGSISDLKNYYLSLKNESKTIRYCQLSLFLNKAYALRYGYKLIISNLSAYNTTMVITGRHPSWMKVHFIYDLQNKLSPSECEWFSYLDSDAYFWMDRHSLSLDDFIASSSVHEVSLDYDERESKRQSLRGYLHWQKQSQVFIIGQNGQYDNVDLGVVNKRLDSKGDFVCAGTWLVKNSDKGREIMKQWKDGIDNSTKTSQLLKQYANLHPWEQRGFTQLVYAKYQNDISVFPFRDFNKRDGRAIRHIWSQFGQERIPRMIEALHEIFNISPIQNKEMM
jgi:galactosyl transferase GMA12/MNN10 family